MSEFKVTEVQFTLIKEVDGEKLGSVIRMAPEMVLTEDLESLLVDMASR